MQTRADKTRSVIVILMDLSKLARPVSTYFLCSCEPAELPGARRSAVSERTSARISPVFPVSNTNGGHLKSLWSLACR